VLRIAIAVSIFAGSAAAANYCPMCYTTAASAARVTIHALRSGIVTLVIPPVLLFSGMLAVALRWKSGADSRDEISSGEHHS
jgi:hypothetical protein